jgi:hypothetical protein
MPIGRDSLSVSRSSASVSDLGSSDLGTGRALRHALIWVAGASSR